MCSYWRCSLSLTPLKCFFPGIIHLHHCCWFRVHTSVRKRSVPAQRGANLKDLKSSQLWGCKLSADRLLRVGVEDVLCVSVNSQCLRGEWFCAAFSPQKH